MPGDFFLSCVRPRLEESETLDIIYMHFPIAEWIVLTEDGTDSAQWEHTYLMTENGVEILTH